MVEWETEHLCIYIPVYQVSVGSACALAILIYQISLSVGDHMGNGDF